ncbi:MAG: type III secretion protein [Deltaproteobacteria bacterium]|nr:MAG: type III secretion protein [Deltaproteobacteria bacterium]TNF28400.1 MAG: type III secretion protein [Deltaproteobacteria bacterium]
MNIQVIDYTVLIAFWLTFSRWMAVMMQLPMFDNASVPVMVKVLGTLVITYAFFPYVEKQIMVDINYLGVENFWYLTIYNVVVGLVVGFFVKSIMSVFIAAGSMITQQIGFGAVRYFDPQAGQQIGPFEQLIQWTVLIIVITSGALIPMFKGVLATFHSMHLEHLGKMATSPEFFFMYFKNLFLASLMLASPLIFTNVLIMTVLGVIARTVPQMNVLMVSFVVNIGLGLLVFAATSDEFFHVAFRVYTEKLGDWFQFVI